MLGHRRLAASARAAAGAATSCYSQSRGCNGPLAIELLILLALAAGAGAAGSAARAGLAGYTFASSRDVSRPSKKRH